MNLVEWLLQTDSGVAGLILRLTVAVVIFPHGAQKALGWFGGHGFRGPCNILRAPVFRLSSPSWRSPRNSSARSGLPWDS